jgi:hypothetical protein
MWNELFRAANGASHQTFSGNALPLMFFITFFTTTNTFASVPFVTE